jgi:serine/threonine protein kinase
VEDDFENWLLERHDDVPDAGRELAPGTAVGDYRIVALLGSGGFADVYRAQDACGSAVAMKILHRLDEKSRARFAHESKILSQIRHANIPRLLDFGSYGDRPYMVTELLKPYELPTSDRKVAEFLLQVISAAAELHRHGYVHRDIKPSNILARGDGTPVLIDFGLACPISAAEREKEALSVEDGLKVAVGTVGYSAPEQFSGLGVGPESDVHAIGMLIDRCFGGNMPKCWRRIYLSATASSRKARYQTVAALGRAIARRHWKRLAAAILGALALCALACMCMDAIATYREKRDMPHMFYEDDI